ncbi:MAG: hypothetical protein GX444_13540 [Myxococcales bacterium]|nr:hypothetical protein [Myxococcales bacterium]
MKRWGAPILFILLVATFLVPWLAFVLRFPADSVIFKDEPWHANILLRLLHQPKTGLADIIFANPDYPPLYYLLAFAAAKGTGDDGRLGLALPNLLCFLALLAMAFHLTLQRLPAGRAWLAGFLVGLTTFYWSFSITTEMTLAVTVGLFLYLLLRRDQSPWTPVWLGLAGGLALLAKQTTPLYLAGAVLFYSWEKWRPSLGLARAATRLAVVGLVAAAVAGAVFYHRGDVFLVLGPRIARGSLYHTIDKGAVARLLFYPRYAAPQLGFLVLALLGWRRKRPDAAAGALLVTVLLATVALSLYSSKFPEYIMPAAFPLALLFVWSLGDESALSPAIRAAVALSLVPPLLVLAGWLQWRFVHVAWEARSVGEVSSLIRAQNDPATPLPTLSLGSGMWQYRLENVFRREAKTERLPVTSVRLADLSRPDMARFLLFREMPGVDPAADCGTAAELRFVLNRRDWPPCDDCLPRLAAMLQTVNREYRARQSGRMGGEAFWTLCERPDRE